MNTLIYLFKTKGEKIFSSKSFRHLIIDEDGKELRVVVPIFLIAFNNKS